MIHTTSSVFADTDEKVTFDVHHDSGGTTVIVGLRQGSWGYSTWFLDRPGIVRLAAAIDAYLEANPEAAPVVVGGGA